ncbi:hypothetical protein [Vibrio gigantis]|uniref:hypothetical protein n=1 Tax=Vibrio gigantis TaxID=296199 RepID=UPI001BFDA843|nr:hypothetical protein [Vibrio gigantis]
MIHNPNIISLIGTHGTCVTHAKSIDKVGFNRVGTGRHGTGLYLWYANRNMQEALKLAECWAKDAKNRGDYKHCDEQSPATFECTLNTVDDLLVDLNDEDTHELFQDYVREHIDILKDPKHGSEKERAAKVADAFIQDLEKEIQNKISVVKTKTIAPHSYLGTGRNRNRPAEHLGLNRVNCLVVYDLGTIVPHSVKRVL